MKFLPVTSRDTRWIIAGAVALAGALTMAVILMTMSALEETGSVMLVSAAVGAGISGFLFAGFFGQIRRAMDWLLFAVGSVLATALGSFLGGVFWGLLIPIFDTIPQNEFFLMFLLRTGALGFMVVMVIMPTEHPATVGIWALIMLTAQGLSVWARAQRTAA